MLGSRYALRSRTRGGGDDAVWAAYDQTLDRIVSVRVVATSHPHVEAMLDAARRAASVEDPRLLRVLDVGRDPSVAFVVSESVDAATLAVRLRTAPLPAELVRTVVGETALALENIRHRGLHHLVLTPDDIHVIDDETVKILGVAVHAALAGDDDTTAEQASARDTEGLIAVAYAGLTGYWPLATPSGLPPAPRVGSVPAPPSEIVSGVPADLDALCAQAFAGAGAPASPGALADQIAPWGRARRPARGFPHPLPATAPAEVADPATDIDLRDHATPPAGRPGRPGDTTARPPRPRPAASAAGGRVRRVLTDEAAAAAGLGGTLAGATPRPTSARQQPSGGKVERLKRTPASRPVTAAGTDAAPAEPASAPAGLAAMAAPALAAARSAFSRLSRPPHRPDEQPPPTSAPGDVRAVRTVPFSTLAPDLFDDDRAEPAAPLLPATPLSRPPRDQTRAVLLVMAGFIAVVLLLGYCGLRGLGSSGAAAPTAAPEPIAAPADTASATTTPTPTPTPSTSAAAGPVRIAAVTGFDPQGDGQEKSSTTGDAYDGDPGTAWESETYRSDTYGGLKDGVGLLVDLGAPTRVTSLTARLGGVGATVELRAATGATLDGSRVIASADDVSGTVPLRAATPVTTRYLVLWFTTPSRVDGGYRAVVDELSVR